MKKSALWSFMLLLVMALFLAACNNDSSKTEKENEKDTSGDTTTTTDEPSTEGGIVTYGTDVAPEGVYDPAYSGSIVDSYIQNFTMEGIYDVNDDLEYVPNLASWEISEDKLTYTFTFQKGVKWHNGEELTADDWVLL